MKVLVTRGVFLYGVACMPQLVLVAPVNQASFTSLRNVGDHITLAYTYLGDHISPGDT